MEGLKMMTISCDVLLIFTKLILFHENFILKIQFVKIKVFYEKFLP